LSRSRTLMKIAATTAALSAACANLAQAAGRDRSMMRVLACTGDQVAMEVYLPLEVAMSDILNMKPTYGYYTLDLTEPGKGKPLEPVLVSISEDEVRDRQPIYPQAAADPHSGRRRHGGF
jgi:hypothetical protein